MAKSSGSFVKDRYCFTKKLLDDFVSPGRSRYGRWRPPDISTEDYSRHVVVEGEIGRIDLIAYREYGDVHLWPVIAYFNSIANPFTDLSVGQILIVPLLSKVQVVSEPSS